MAIAMRLRNQLQSVYKLDPLRNEVSGHVFRPPPHWGRTVRAGKLQKGPEKHTFSREMVVVSAALMERVVFEHAWTETVYTRVVPPEQWSSIMRMMESMLSHSFKDTQGCFYFLNLGFYCLF